MSWQPPYSSYPGYYQGGSDWQQPQGQWQQPSQPQPASFEWQQQTHQAWAPAPVVLDPPLPHPHSATFAPPPPHPSPPVPSVAYTSVAPKKDPPAQPSSGWPSSLRAYVEKAFAVSGLDKQKLQKELAQIINEAKTQGVLWSRNWDSHPLPFSETQQRPADKPPVSFAINTAPRPKLPPIAQRLGKRKGKSVSPPQPPKVRKMEQKLTKGQKKAQQKALAAQQKASIAQQDQKLQKRLQKQEKAKLKAGDFQIDAEDLQRAAERARRFGSGAAEGAVQWHSHQGEQASYASLGSPDAEDLIDGPAVRGTCQNIEKSYFRLTSKPDPSVVRPAPVLQTALDRLVGLIRSGDPRGNFNYFSDQFKGMRQDCTVQHLQTELSARIYEAHARCALENGDVGEFNQCQGQLQQHYASGIPGSKAEFLAYRILYQAVHAGKGGRVALLACLQAVQPEDVLDAKVRYALQVREAIALSDCTRVAQLYSEAPDMSQALLDIIVPKVRLTGLKILLKAHVPHLPVKAVAQRLGFIASAGRRQKVPRLAPEAALPGCSADTFRGRYALHPDPRRGLEQCVAWLASCGAILGPMPGSEDEQAVDSKVSLGQLHMPLESGPIGPDLAIEDFLSRTLM